MGSKLKCTGLRVLQGHRRDDQRAGGARAADPRAAGDALEAGSCCIRGVRSGAAAAGGDVRDSRGSRAALCQVTSDPRATRPQQVSWHCISAEEKQTHQLRTPAHFACSAAALNTTCNSVKRQKYAVDPLDHTSCHVGADWHVCNCRDLSSGRMQLRGATQQTREKFGDAESFSRLTAALGQLSALLDAAKAAQQ
jgi:hypothetical protein